MILPGTRTRPSATIPIARVPAGRLEHEHALRFRRLADSNIIGIALATDTSIIDANDAFLAMAGWTRDELARGTLRWRDRVAAEYHPAVEAALTEVIQHGACRPLELEAIRQDGTRVPVLVAGAIFDSAKPTVIAFAVDLTERKRLESELRLQTQAAVAAERAKDALLASVAHELAQPLSPMLTALQLLVDSAAGSEPMQRHVAVLLRQTRRLQELVSDLLDAKRCERGTLSVHPRRVRLNDVVDEVREEVQRGFSHVQIAFECAIGEEPLWISGDPSRLQQVLLNLLNNARKFTPPGGLVRLTMGAEGGCAIVRVSDTGEGIPESDLPHIFDMYRQVHAGRAGGLGIGLALARALVQMHGGTIEARSGGPEHGTEFTVRLPIAAEEGARALYLAS